MSKFIAVDCGKYNTKVESYDSESGKRRHFKFRTKISPGTLDDDMLERGTFIVQTDDGDGEVYKIGNDARKEPDMETSKKSEIHRICSLAAIAMAAGPGVHEDLSVVIGMPLSLCSVPEERLSYKKYILGEPGEKHVVNFVTNPNDPDPVQECVFTISKELVYPEGIGVIYEYPAKLSGPTAVLDIGNLNINNTYTDNFNIVNESCFSDELGGKVLITGLAQELTSELGARVDENLAASTLLRPLSDRYLHTTSGNKEIDEKSREIIDRYLLEHVRAIKQKCATRHWPLEFMNVVCVGGTSKLLIEEIKQVFGANAFIPDNPEYANASGFLKKMCADAGIDLTGSGK